MEHGIEVGEIVARERFAEQLSVQAGSIIRRYYYGGTARTETKSDGSPVTDADRDAERFLRNRINDAFPHDSVLGEEYGEQAGDNDWKWILDPIDGTKSFVTGVPLFTVLIAVVRDGAPQLGVIHNPITNETVSASIGNGCRFNGAPTSVRPCDDLAGAMVLTTDPAELARRRPNYSRALTETAGSIRTWADGYGYLLVATGRADAMIDPIVQPWDVAPLYPVITEAGGILTDCDGNRSQESLATSALAATPGVHRALLNLAHER